MRGTFLPAGGGGGDTSGLDTRLTTAEGTITQIVEALGQILPFAGAQTDALLTTAGKLGPNDINCVKWEYDPDATEQNRTPTPSSFDIGFNWPQAAFVGPAISGFFSISSEFRPSFPSNGWFLYLVHVEVTSTPAPLLSAPITGGIGLSVGDRQMTPRPDGGFWASEFFMDYMPALRANSDGRGEVAVHLFSGTPDPITAVTAASLTGIFLPAAPQLPSP